jgi:DNA-binding transcriptional ArsR family regulator
VLREVGVLRVRGEGRRRFYRLNADALRPIHDWLKPYEQNWSDAFEALDNVLVELEQEEQPR